MKLNMPKVTTWWIAVILGVVCIVLYIINSSPFALIGFLLVAVAWLLLVLGTSLKGL